MQSVIWCIQLKNGEQIYEFDSNNNENSFIKNLVRKNEFEFISLIDRINNIKYSIDLKTGEFLFNDIPMSLSKNLDGRTYNFTNLSNVNYADGVIHYKCSEEMNIGGPIRPANFNIGYKIPWNFKYKMLDSSNEVIDVIMTHAQPTITVDAKTLRAGVSILLTCKTVDKNGSERYYKL